MAIRRADSAERRSKDRVTLRAMVDEYLAIKTANAAQKPARDHPLSDRCRLLRRPAPAADRYGVTQGRRHAAIGDHPPARRCHPRLARSALSAFFVWCMQTGMTEANPVIGTLQAEKKTARARARRRRAYCDLEGGR